MEVEIDPAQRPLAFGLAENDGELAVKGDAVTHVRAANFVSFDCLLHQVTLGCLGILRHLVYA